MRKIRCGLFFIILFFSFGKGLADEKDSFDLEPIVITKSKYYSNFYTVKKENLENFGFKSPIEILSILPIDLQSRSLESGIQSDFSLRGSTFQGVSILFNGQRINDPQTAHHNCDIPLTVEDIKKIEIVPGTDASLLGPDAIGGTINFMVKKPETKIRVLKVGGGEHKSSLGLFSISDKFQDLGIRLSIEDEQSDGYRDDTDFKKFTSTLTTSLDVPDGEFTAIWGYQEKEFGAYDFYTPGLGYQSKEWTKTHLFNTGLNLDKQGFIIKPNFLWRRHYDKFMLDKTQIRSNYLNHHRTDMYTPNIYVQKETDIIGKIGLGIEYGQERLNSTGLGKHNRSHKSIFMDQNQDLNNKLSLALSFRLDDFDGFGKEYTGATNLSYEFRENQLFSIGAARNIRVPSFTELYYNDPTTVGNSGLCAEKSLNYQLGYELKGNEIKFGFTMFLRKEADFIDWVKRSLSQTKWEASNLTRANVFGLENNFKWEINNLLTFNSYYTYIDKHINDNEYAYKYGPNYSRHLFNSDLLFNFPFGTEDLNLIYKKKPGRAGWVIFNTHLSYKFNKSTQLLLDISNLFNTEYQEIEGVPQPGRLIEAGIKINW